MEIFQQNLGFENWWQGHEDVNYHGPNVYESLNDIVNFADCWLLVTQFKVFSKIFKVNNDITQGYILSNSLLYVPP